VGAGHCTLSLKTNRGHVNVDVLKAKIVGIEVLLRDEVRARLLELLP
jgi:hypothetical protein